MNVIYNSPHFWILAYGAGHGVELYDKEYLRTVFLQGPSAWHFEKAMRELPDGDQESMDAFIEDYCAEMAKPIVFH